mmetsp:Transcript_12480/g.37108  ORF Transcript_12480/g.37108 Transcript_12480/m.37108 type:complete len:309 (+) Transcript_12480:173-1099(+)
MSFAAESSWTYHELSASATPRATASAFASEPQSRNEVALRPRSGPVSGTAGAMATFTPTPINRSSPSDSTSMPATFAPSSRTSFGHFSVTRQRESTRKPSSTRAISTPTRSGTSVSGAMGTASRATATVTAAFPVGSIHFRPCVPRPLVCLSVATASTSEQLPRSVYCLARSSRAASMVDDVDASQCHSSAAALRARAAIVHKLLARIKPRLRQAERGVFGPRGDQCCTKSGLAVQREQLSHTSVLRAEPHSTSHTFLPSRAQACISTAVLSRLLPPQEPSAAKDQSSAANHSTEARSSQTASGPAAG